MPSDSGTKAEVAIITGGGSGIGAAIAEALVKQGWSVMVCGRREQPLRQLCERLGERCAFRVADVTEEESLKQAVRATEEHFGPISTLVNNAGVMPIRKIADLDLGSWRKAIEVNVIGVLNGIAAVLPGMLERGTGDIINVGSVGALAVLPDRMAYSASKHAVRAITEALRIELAGKVRAVEINPGATESELFSASNQGSSAQESSGSQVNPVPAAAIAEAVMFALQRPRSETVSEITLRPSMQVA